MLQPDFTGFQACVGQWCLQDGTREQYTRCESASSDGLTCYNPEIRYGNVEGGIPSQHGGNQLSTWCGQLGFGGYTGTTYGGRDVSPPKGRLFGCTGYDESTWHWCDWQDGNWRNEQLDYHYSSGTEITSLSCSTP
ncbi:MAG: hypothetical protein ISP91_13560 [Pseudomonadales bacterium]|nr:hypothetical protein [Pseudomonadales bacterium]